MSGWVEFYNETIHYRKEWFILALEINSTKGCYATALSLYIDILKSIGWSTLYS